MKSTAHKLLLAIGLISLSSLSLNAAVDSLLILDAKCYSQKKVVTTPERVEGQVAKTRLDTKQLLQLLAKDVGVTYTNGSRLKVVAGEVYVADSNGKELGNVSQYFQLMVNTNSGLLNGARNLKSNEERTQNYQSMSFTINLPRLKGKVTGLLTEKIEISSPNKLGVQVARANGGANVSGKGAINGNLAYFEGDFRLEGREAILNR